MILKRQLDDVRRQTRTRQADLDEFISITTNQLTSNDTYDDVFRYVQMGVCDQQGTSSSRGNSATISKTLAMKFAETFVNSSTAGSIQRQNMQPASGSRVINP